MKIALQQTCTEAGACLGIVWKLEDANLKVVDVDSIAFIIGKFFYFPEVNCEKCEWKLLLIKFHSAATTTAASGAAITL